MKGLILSGGKGTRLRPLTYTRAKQLLPLANKPVLFYAIEALIEAGICDIGIVVGDTHAEIEAAIGNASRWGPEISITYIYQPAPLGLAHAVKIAQPFLENQRFVMFLGDNLIGEPLTPVISHFAAPDCPYQCSILLAEVPNPQQFGVAEIDTTSGTPDPKMMRVRRLVEKPLHPPSNLALVGMYCFDPTIFQAVESIQPSARGELEITDAIQWLIDHTYQVHAQLLAGYWIDTGKMEDILDANRQILLGISPSIASSAVVSPTSVLSGAVVLQADCVIENSVVRGPAIIGERTVLRNAYIGPFTSVYHDVVVEASEIEYSILLEHSKVISVRGRIEESLIGRYAEVHTSSRKPHGHKLILGDHSRVGITSPG
ncbi:MAG TPA: glucose-1-phosphate thymidylyltransferase [Ktedonobacterales bacterium]|jgi:glucose-1-phosphate thymidylyltransferase